jgi:Txe/YoeB family toxin of Txe-Axe toxin-antitoxin module
MSPEPEAWQPRFSAFYLEQLGDRRYRARRKEIDRRLAQLLRDPYTAAKAERLRYQYAGLRSAQVFDATRFIYRLCEECRKREEERTLPLDCCLDGNTPARTVNILCLSEHYADMPAEFDFDA